MEKIEDAIKRLEDCFYDERLAELYGEEDVENQRKRYVKLFQWHRGKFPVEEATIISSPGRCELGGNHTAHQGGMVLAAAIHLDSIAVVHPTDSMIVTVQSENYPLISVNLDHLAPKEEEKGTTESMIRGIAAVLKKRGHAIGGFEASIVSSVLPGTGLSSSIEILIASIYNNLYNESEIGVMELAFIACEAESIFFDKSGSLIDQLACGSGGIIAIDFKDQTSPQITPIDFHFTDHGYTLAIIQTGGEYSSVSQHYEAVPEEMKNAASILGKERCRESTEVDLLANMDKIRETLGDRTFLRALHFFRENKRVDLMTEALLNQNMEDFLRQVRHSGNSSFKYIQNGYPPGDSIHQEVALTLALCEGFLGENGVCRIHGGGFAGTIEAYIPTAVVEDFKSFIGSLLGEDRIKIVRIRLAPAGPVLLT